MKYQDIQAYLEHFMRLLELEAQEAQRQYQDEMERRSLHERRQRGVTWHPVIITEQSFGFGGKLYLTLERSQQIGKPHKFQVGDPISISAYEEGRATEAVKATITAVWRDRMRAALSVEEMPDWMDSASLGIDRLFDEVTFRQMRYALEQLGEGHTRQQEVLKVLLGLEQPRMRGQQPDTAAFPSLNPSQQEAVKQVLGAEEAAIIHGPPGTGKTTTLVEAIKRALNSEKQVLVCAPSNTAVDLLTERLAAKGLKVLRIGNPARVGEELLTHTVEGRMQQHPEFKRLKKLRKEADEYRRRSGQYKRKFGAEQREQRKQLRQESRRIRKEVERLEDYLVESTIAEAQVVTATLVGASSRYLKGRSFSTAFIDEAGQALSPACLIPLLKSEKLVLAGDPWQLPPTVKSQEASKQGLEQTLIETAIKLQPGLSTLLDTQYRMNEQIMQFSSEQFYQGRLKADSSVAHHLLHAQMPAVTFIDTAGRGFEEKREGEGGSRFNEGEAELVLKHWEETRGTWRQSQPQEYINALETGVSIGIISPYRAQVTRLSELLPPAQEGISVRVQSVDGFQGQEQDVIYVSLVRSNDSGDIGFLKDTRRMNVALTRARKLLVVIGDSATLAQHPFYKDFMDYIDRIGAYRSAWEYG